MEPGATFKFRHTVTDADTAAALEPITGDDFPAVLATTKSLKESLRAAVTTR